MISRYKSRILQHVTHRDYEPRRVHSLATELGVTAEDEPEFRKAIDALIDAGQVVMGSGQTLALPPLGKEVIGRFKLNQRGFGFVIPDTTNAHGDLFVPAPHTNGALTGDRVRASVIHSKHRAARSGHSPYTGRIEEVLKRGSAVFVGTLEKRGDLHIVHVDGGVLHDPVVIRDPTAKNARPGLKVVIELTQYPEDNMLGEGVITEVLGEQGAPDVETTGIIRAFGLREGFPDDVKADATAIVRDYNDNTEDYYADRLDLRDTFILTIDPPDAKDFDDAISLEIFDNGECELGVHIADVATFIRSGMAIDTEAYERGNSTYLPRLVLPMLPEVLSNGICSLQPGVPRLTKSAFIRFDENGGVCSTRFANSVIQSNHRLTYLEAQALIDGDPVEAKKHAKSENEYSDRLIKSLKAMHDLSKRIRQRRLRAGMFVLDLPEVELVFDEEGHVINAVPEDNAYTHTLIEMFMVEANEAVARLFNDLDIPIIRRTHPEPTSFDVETLRAFTRVAGYNIPANPDRKQLQSLLDAVRGKPAARAVHLAVLKTLTQAVYSPSLVGHFALASEHYTHFTSPIRRYPDLTVHRALEAALSVIGNHKGAPRDPKARKRIARELDSDPRILDGEKLLELGGNCSSTERNSSAAERELRDILVLQVMAKHVGETFPATVTGVTGFGAFLSIDKYLVEGLIKTGDLPGPRGERWSLHEQTGSLVAQRSGSRITLGDTYTVIVNKVDLQKREMDLLIVEDTDEPKKKYHNKTDPRAEKQSKPKSKKSRDQKKQGKRRRR